MRNLADREQVNCHERRSCKRPDWLFEIEPYSRSDGRSLTEIRDDLRLKKVLKRAVGRDFAPLSLIEAIRAGIRA